MFEKELKNLQRVLIKEDDFSKILNYFMTNFAENERFLRLSKKTKSPMVKALIEAIGERQYGKGQFRITNLFLQKVKKTKMIHGPFLINNELGSVFYFEDINMGMVTIAKMKGRTEFFRISSHNLSKNKSSTKLSSKNAISRDIPKKNQ